MTVQLFTFAAAAAVLLVVYRWVTRRVLTMATLRQLRIVPPRVEVIAPDDIPQHLPALFDGTRRRLEALGFYTVGYLRVLPPLRSDDDVTEVCVMRNPVTSTIAKLVDAGRGIPALPAHVSFQSVLSDGSVLETVDGIDVELHRTKHARVNYSRALTLEVLYDDHRRTVRASDLSAVAPPETIEEIAAFERGRAERRREELLQSGLVVTGPEGHARFRADHLRGLVSLWIRAERDHAELTKRRLAAELAVNPRPVPLPLECEVRVLRRFERARNLQAHKRMRVALVLGMLAFTAFCASPFVSARALGTAAAVLVAVALHQLGHLGAMGTFGFRHRRLFLLPLFGAASSGEKPHARWGEWLWITLAGPVPGILLGVVLLARPWAADKAFGPIDHFAELLIAINLLSLVPVPPLDGGRLLELLMGVKRPWVTVGLQLLSAALALATAALIDMPVWMKAALVLPALGLLRRGRGRVTFARLRARLERPLAEADDPERSAFELIHAAGHASLPAEQKCALARRLVDTPLGHAAMWPLALVLMAACYAAVAAFGAAMLIPR